MIQLQKMVRLMSSSRAIGGGDGSRCLPLESGRCELSQSGVEPRSNVGEAGSASSEARARRVRAACPNMAPEMDSSAAGAPEPAPPPVPWPPLPDGVGKTTGEPSEGPAGAGEPGDEGVEELTEPACPGAGRPGVGADAAAPRNGTDVGLENGSEAEADGTVTVTPRIVTTVPGDAESGRSRPGSEGRSMPGPIGVDAPGRAGVTAVTVSVT